MSPKTKTNEEQQYTQEPSGAKWMPTRAAIMRGKTCKRREKMQSASRAEKERENAAQGEVKIMKQNIQFTPRKMIGWTLS